MNELAKTDPLNQLAKAGKPETSDQVRADLERSRAKMAGAVEALRNELKSSVGELQHTASEVTREIKVGAAAIKRGLNWKLQVAKHPWGWVAGAVVVGILLGSRRRT